MFQPFLGLRLPFVFKYLSISKNSINFSLAYAMESPRSEIKDETVKEISEGSAIIRTKGKVFYNPVQEFNRDLSISVITAFNELYLNERRKEHDKKELGDATITNNDGELKELGIKNEDGVSILEALTATGLRSIRYAKEIPNVKEIIANDRSDRAIEDIKENIKYNNIGHLITPSHADAIMLMYQHKEDNQFDIIDLDPYGCPSVFLDSAVQAVKDGGLLLITATDMAILAGNSPQTCYRKYGSISLKIKSCHEMALRILLQCVESHANRYKRYIIPLLSLSADFYIRVFVRIYSGAQKCKYTTSKLSLVYHCTGCDSFSLQPLGVLKTNSKNNKTKFAIPTGPPVSCKCEHCAHPHHIGGPIWSGPLHSTEFVRHVLNTTSQKLNTYKRIQGVLSVILEELIDIPLYYTLERLSGTIHVEMPPMMSMRSALLNAGYKVSLTHMNKTSIKTNAPARVVWDIMRCWAKLHPVSEKRLVAGTPACHILQIQPQRKYSFEMHPEANPISREKGYLRFQENPSSHWGPGCKATAMVGEERIEKSKRNQGKRKREVSKDSLCNNSE